MPLYRVLVRELTEREAWVYVDAPTPQLAEDEVFWTRDQYQPAWNEPRVAREVGDAELAPDQTYHANLRVPQEA